MAAFIAKQMVGQQFSSVKGEYLLQICLMQFCFNNNNNNKNNLFASITADMGGAEGPSAEERSKLEEDERERLLALQEAEDCRKEKHRKLEAERERMRQGVREKVSR